MSDVKHYRLDVYNRNGETHADMVPSASSRFSYVKSSDYDLALKELEGARAQVKRLKDLAWNLDDYTIHTRPCENFHACTCGLKKHRMDLPEYSKEEIEESKRPKETEGNK